MTSASRPVRVVLLLCALSVPAATSRTEGASLVFCSPGSPGDTAQARPAMEQLARAVEKAGGLPAGTLSAEYHESEAAGVAAIRVPGTLFAAVPVPFFVQHEKDLGLDPRLGITAASGQPERFALVAHKGSVAKPADLQGWEVTGPIGYAPGFVRRAFAKEFGALPEGATISFNATPLQALRRAASGDKLAVLLDATQSASLATLPFGADLTIVAHSEPLPSGLVCALKTTASGGKSAPAILKGLERLAKSPEGKDALAGIRVERFDPIDAAGVARIRAAAGQESGPR